MISLNNSNINLKVAEGAKAAGASRIIGLDIDSKKFDIGTPGYLTPFWSFIIAYR